MKTFIVSGEPRVGKTLLFTRSLSKEKSICFSSKVVDKEEKKNIRKILASREYQTIIFDGADFCPKVFLLDLIKELKESHLTKHTIVVLIYCTVPEEMKNLEGVTYVSMTCNDTVNGR